MRSKLWLTVLLVGLPPGAWADVYDLRTGDTYAHHGFAQMRSCEKGENLPPEQRPADYCGHPYVVGYFTDQSEREPFRVVIAGGVIRRAQAPHRLYPDGGWFFVMDRSGNFYFFRKNGEPPIHHSSFFSGAPVASGGNVVVENGMLTALGSHTGHYLMTPAILENAHEALRDDGVDIGSLQDLDAKN